MYIFPILLVKNKNRRVRGKIFFCSYKIFIAFFLFRYVLACCNYRPSTGQVSRSKFECQEKVAPPRLAPWCKLSTTLRFPKLVCAFVHSVHPTEAGFCHFKGVTGHGDFKFRNFLLLLINLQLAHATQYKRTLPAKTNFPSIPLETYMIQISIVTNKC